MGSTRLRWFILLCSLTVTLVAIWYPVDDTSTAPLVQQKKLSAPAVNAPPKYVNSQFVEQIEGESEDPFAPRAWVPAPAVNQIVASNTAPMQTQVVADAAPGIPQLPYRFLGKLLDGEDLIVYLGRGDQTIIARLGEVLEGTYKVVGLNDKSMEFEHLPTNEKQILSIE